MYLIKVVFGMLFRILLLVCVIAVVATFINGGYTSVLKQSLWAALAGLIIGLLMYFAVFGKKSDGDIIAQKQGRRIWQYSASLGALMSAAVGTVLYLVGYIVIATWQFCGGLAN